MILSFDMSLISVAHLVLLIGIETVGGLVEDQHLRIVQQRLGQADAALEALRERFDRLFEHAAQLQPLDHVVEPMARRRSPVSPRTFAMNSRKARTVISP